MHEDKGPSVKAYLDWSVLKVFQMKIMCSGHEFFYCVSQNEAMMSACGEVLGKECKSNKMSEMQVSLAVIK